MNQYSMPLAGGQNEYVPADAAAPGFTAVPLPTMLFRTAWRRRWYIVGVMAFTLIAGLILTMLTTPLYSATSQLEISREGNRVTEIQSVERETSVADLEFYQTQYGLLKSRSLAEQIAQKLRLSENPQFFSLFRVKYESIGAKLPGGSTAPAAKAMRVRVAGVILLKNVQIEPVRGSRLVNITFTSADPDLSMKIANEWGDSFIQTNLGRRFEATAYARKFLENRLQDLRQRLEQSERQLVAYASEQGIINLPGTVDRQTGAATGERSLLADELTRLTEELSTATAERIQAESVARSSNGGANDASLKNDAINLLRQKRAELAADYAKLLVQFEPNYPPAQAIASQIANLDKSIAREENRVGATLNTSFSASRLREAGLQAKVDALKGKLTDLRSRSIQYNIYQREADTNRQLYDALLQRYKEIGVAGGVGTNNIAVVDRAERPTSPSKPNFFLNILLSLFAGTVLAIALVWLLEQIQEGVSDPTEVPRSLGVPLLGTVPSGPRGPLIELADPKSPMVEAYLGIQTNLEFATAHGAPRSIAITSSRPKEGKSTTAYALAHSLARAKRKVVLVDGDLRSPNVHSEFQLPNTFGVSNLLTGSDNIAEALRPSARPGLSVITAGPQPPNAAELFTGERFGEIIAKLLTQFDHVIVDCPPVMGLADALLITNAVEGTIYAIEAHSTRARAAQISISRLRTANAHLLGVVLTRFDVKESSYGYGTEYGYGYGREASADPAA